MKLKSKGLDLDTVSCIGYKLSQLDRETDLNDPVKVAEHIADLKLNFPFFLQSLKLRELDGRVS